MANETSEDPALDLAAAERDARLIRHLRTSGVGDRAPEIRAAFGRLDAACEVLSQQDLVRVGLAFNGMNSFEEFMDLIRRNRTHGNQ